MLRIRFNDLIPNSSLASWHIRLYTQQCVCGGGCHPLTYKYCIAWLYPSCHLMKSMLPLLFPAMTLRMLVPLCECPYPCFPAWKTSLFPISRIWLHLWVCKVFLCVFVFFFLMLPTFHPIRRRNLHPRFRARSRAVFISLHDFVVILSTSSPCAKDSTEQRPEEALCMWWNLATKQCTSHSFCSMVWDQPGTGCLCHFSSRGSQAQTFRPFLPVFLSLKCPINLPYRVGQLK